MATSGYRQKKKLFKPIELTFYRDLQVLAGEQLQVLAKIPLRQIIEPNVNQWERNSGWDHLYQQIQDKDVDFVIFDLNWNVICLINVIDSETGEQVDAVTHDAAYTAKLPLLNIFSYQQFSIEELAQKIAEQVQQVAETSFT